MNTTSDDAARRMKALITARYRQAYECNFDNETQVLSALCSVCNGIDVLLSLIYRRLYDSGAVRAALKTLELETKCNAVADQWNPRRRYSSVNRSNLTFVMAYYNALKHQVLPRVGHAGERLNLGTQICRELFEYYFGESLLDEGDCPRQYEAPTGGTGVWRVNDLAEPDDLTEFIRKEVRARIEVHLDTMELELFDDELLTDGFLAGVVDSATLRRAGSLYQWLTFAWWPLEALRVKLLDADPDEYATILAAKAMNALTDIKTFIRDEAWGARVATNVLPETDDAELAYAVTLRRLCGLPAGLPEAPDES